MLLLLSTRELRSTKATLCRTKKMTTMVRVVRELALLHPTPTARQRLLMPPPQMQRLQLWQKLPRLDLCAMHGIKTLPCKTLPERECKMQQNGSHSEII